MARHSVVIEWERNGAVYSDRRYSRAHSWTFDGGLTVPASSSPHVVPPPLSVPANVDPEEAYVAALSSCHMLWFLDIAARRGFVVDSYRDEAEGFLEADDWKKLAITRVILHPHVEFKGSALPGDADVAALHHQAHDSCFLANSVKTVIETQGTWTAL